ncbi:hypothetical protein [Pseudogracilibacillus sp. SO30301A]|uniref:hypothetical protein n=1 Tax=Pseudogracilibacillus sp. SO30301A TaxID=3098291 RepID=UPI00300E67AB
MELSSIYAGFEVSRYTIRESRVEINNKDLLGRVEGETSIARVEADTTLGWDDCNVHADGEAGVLTADGYARADTGGIGFKGNASLAHASAKGGFTLWGTDIDLGVSVGNVGGRIDLVWDHIEIELNILAGASLYIDFPW